MRKLRYSIYIINDYGRDENGNPPRLSYQDTIIEAKPGPLDAPEELRIELIQEADGNLYIRAEGQKYRLKDEEEATFDLWSEDWIHDGGGTHYQFIIEFSD